MYVHVESGEVPNGRAHGSGEAAVIQGRGRCMGLPQGVHASSVPGRPPR